MYTVSLTTAVQSALNMVQDRADAQLVNIVRTGDWSNHSVIAGQIRLEQVMLNILNNALDVLPDGGTISVDLAPEQVVISDTGPGMENPERVFEPFYTTKELGAAKGLGCQSAFKIDPFVA